jgi:hypothetical protein
MLEAAEREFATKGCARSATDDIADAAGDSLSGVGSTLSGQVRSLQRSGHAAVRPIPTRFHRAWERSFIDPLDEREVMRLMISDPYDHR